MCLKNFLTWQSQGSDEDRAEAKVDLWGDSGHDSWIFFTVSSTLLYRFESYRTFSPPLSLPLSVLELRRWWWWLQVRPICVGFLLLKPHEINKKTWNIGKQWKINWDRVFPLCTCWIPPGQSCQPNLIQKLPIYPGIVCCPGGGSRQQMWLYQLTVTDLKSFHCFFQRSFEPQVWKNLPYRIEKQCKCFRYYFNVLSLTLKVHPQCSSSPVSPLRNDRRTFLHFRRSKLSKSVPIIVSFFWTNWNRIKNPQLFSIDKKICVF